MILAALLVMYANFILSTIALFSMYQREQRIGRLLPFGCVMAAETIYIATLMLIQDGEYRAYLHEETYAWIAVFIFMVKLVRMYGRIRKYRNQISKSSIQEGTDQLPLGLCFYDANGMPVLTNQRMNELAAGLTGEPVRNAAVFGGQVSGKTLPVGDRYYDFRTEQIQSRGGHIYQLSAVDITRQQSLYLALDRENASLKEMNERLLEYSTNVEALTHAEEVLKTKMDIHDRMGRMLLETKIFIESGGTDYQDVIKRWHQTVQIFRGSLQQEPETDLIDSLKQIAASMNLAIEIKGEIAQQPVFIRAVKECITNAVRHAHATRLMIEAEERSIQISNNGVIPAEGITEGGGLTDLRRTVEQGGGTMQIELGTEFVLHIQL